LRSAFCQAQFAKRQSSAFSFKRILPSAFCLCSEHVVSSSGCTATPQAHFSGSHAHFHSSAFSFHSVHSIQPSTFCVHSIQRIFSQAHFTKRQSSAICQAAVLSIFSQVHFAKRQSSAFSIQFISIQPSTFCVHSIQRMSSQAHFHSIQFIYFSQARFAFIQFSASAVNRISPSASLVRLSNAGA